MKLLAALLSVSVLTAGAARASPLPTGVAPDDALADGTVDVEDLASRPLAARRVPARRTPVPAGRGGDAWVSLVGFDRTSTLSDRREVGGGIVVGLPFDRLFLPRGALAARAVPAPLDLVRTAASTPPADPLDPLALPRLARSCVAAAVRAAGLAEDDDRIDTILARARWSAILPEARFRAVRFTDARLSLDTGTDTSRTYDYAGANVGLEARLTWRFDRLIYADDEPAFERLRLEQKDVRTRLAQRVLETLFHWARATLDLRTLPPSQQGTRDEADVQLRIAEAEAALDVLTGGWFGGHRPRVRPPAAGGAVVAPRSGGDL